jgi:NADH-quinone oxidoreductase subunit I
MSIFTEAMKNLFSKPFTKKYPKEKIEPFPRFRGRLRYEPKKCIGCRKCEISCPPKAIRFIRKRKINIDMQKCIFCGYCQDVCPTKAIIWTGDFEWGGAKKSIKAEIV